VTSSKKPQTIGYWYRPLMHFGLCQGPIDAFLEFRGGDHTAWKGEQTQTGEIYVDAGNLWGGEKAEGGIEGYVDVLFGEQTQQPSAYLAANLGTRQPAYRGKATVLFKGGRYGAMNPYPKPASFKVRRILRGWDGDPWYPERAAIPMGTELVLSGLGPTATGWRYKVVPLDSTDDYSADGYDDSSWALGQSPFASAGNHPFVEEYGYPPVANTNWPLDTKIWVRRQFPMQAPVDMTLQIFIDNFASVWVNGTLLLNRAGSTNPGASFTHVIDVPASVLRAGNNTIALLGEDVGSYSYAAFKVLAGGNNTMYGMNPAHLIYDALASQNMQGEPSALINDDSFRAAADRLYVEGFGLCTKYDPASATVDDFRQRICNVIGAYCSRSRTTGQWHLDLVRGDYLLESLPVLTDDDVIEYEEQPSTLEDAVNRITVEWFDPETKQSRSTTPLHSLGAIRAMGGVVSQTQEYHEIPVESLALRAGARDLRNTATPLKRMTLVTNRVPRAWRIGTFFRAQLPKRGIADMVCMVGEIDVGTLRSSAIRLSAIQDVFSMPDTTYIVGEPGDDTSPQTPTSPPRQRIFEAPYLDLAGTLSNGELAALPIDAGFLLAVATRPTVGTSYALYTAAAGEDFGEGSIGSWCPGATVEEEAGLLDTVFTVTAQSDLSRVTLGTAALWEDEICRVDALDPITKSLTLARGCVDTVPAKHMPGTIIYFYDDWATSDAREYANGETVDALVLSRTTQHIQDPGDTVPLSMSMVQRAFRPYPPARIRINGEQIPAYLFGELVLEWAHRDRLLQADQLVDNELGNVGPEPGTTYTVRWYLAGILVQTDTGIAGTTQAYTPVSDGAMRVEVESWRDGVTSLQMQVREFHYTTGPVEFLETETGELLTTEAGDPISLE
jgi:hypothetical protein